MFDHIRNLISDCEAVESIKENRYSPENGIIYLRLNTDDNVAPQLRYFQPENSAVVVEDGEIVEFDVRLGKWEPEDRDATMSQIRDAVRESRRDTYLPPLRVDMGGGAGFVPHARLMNDLVPAEPFVTFLTRLTAEIDFLQTHRTL
jgi:hypothetical protein